MTYKHSPEIWIFICDIIRYNYNAVIHVTVQVTHYSYEMVFQQAVSHALSVWHPQREFATQHEQKEVLSCLYRSQDVCAWLPTMYGKSMCLQLLPFVYDFKLG